jgi:hypothetical protein
MKLRQFTQIWWLSPLTVAMGMATAAEPQQERPWMVSEARLPEAFPGPGPVDAVVVKTYPAHRLARVVADGGANGLFMKLFRHIERNEIAMTAPVEMSWGDGPAGDAAADAGRRREPTAMAFLYGAPTTGRVGADPQDPRVVVEDVPAITVVSIGLRGAYDAATFERGLGQLQKWLAAHPEWKPSGDPRTLGYNSPFVPGFFKYSEVQQPVVAVAQ